ncbi:MAG: Toluene efflux pump outer membrane protein TtgF [Calditrichaeota bacterium]|nr:Toluene efflux pump outer membrane protein TtgF [Calditrichota bacterium]
MRGADTRQPAVAMTAAFLLAGLLAGCAGWRPVREVETVTPPERYAAAPAEVADTSDSRWWTGFGDSTLNALIDSAFANNLTFVQLLARHEQARAQLAVARASWFPTIGASGSYQRQDFFEEQETGGIQLGPGGDGASSGGGFDPSRVFVIEEQWQVGLSTAYELDLWGRGHAARQAAEATLAASREDLRAYVLSLSALVARSWYSAVSLRRQQGLLDSTIASYENNLALIERRYQRGVANSRDLYQARATLSSARAEAEANAARLAAAEHALSILLADYPDDERAGVRAALPDELPALTPGLPSDLVLRRPDVRAAYQRLVAADRSAAEAVAAMFPSFSLTGSAGGRSPELADALDPANMIWTAIANVTAPIFQGGRLKGQADAAKAAWVAQVAGYRESVLTAFREVEDALANNQRLAHALAHRREQADAARADLRLAMDRYLRGVTDYLPVTIAQTGYLNARRGLIQARYDLIDARISLAAALGGGWMDDVLASAELDEHRTLTGTAGE